MGPVAWLRGVRLLLPVKKGRDHCRVDVAGPWSSHGCRFASLSSSLANTLQSRRGCLSAHNHGLSSPTLTAGLRGAHSRLSAGTAGTRGSPSSFLELQGSSAEGMRESRATGELRLFQSGRWVSKVAAPAGPSGQHSAELPALSGPAACGPFACLLNISVILHGWDLSLPTSWSSCHFWDWTLDSAFPLAGIGELQVALSFSAS